MVESRLPAAEDCIRLKSRKYGIYLAVSRKSTTRLGGPKPNPR
jgi:hypothetical protein